MYRTLQPFEKVGCHQRLETLLSVFLPELAFTALHFGIVHLFIFGDTTRKDVADGGIYGKVQIGKKFEDIVEAYHIIELCEFRVKRERRSACRKRADIGRVVKGLDMLAGTGDGHTVKQLEKVKIEHIENRRCRPLFRRQFRPVVEDFLRPAKYLIDIFGGIEFFIDFLRLPFVCQCKLVSQIGKAVIDRCGGEHENFCFDAGSDDFVHQLLIARLFIFETANIAKIVRFVDHHKVVVAPVDTRKVDPVRVPTGTGEIGVVEDIVVETVFGKDICFEVGVVIEPVFRKLLGAENQYRFIAEFIVFDDSQCRKCFSQPHTIRQNTAVVRLQFVDDTCGGIFLKIVEFLPDQCIFKTGQVVGEYIFVDIFKKFIENIIEHQKIDTLRSVLFIDCRDVFYKAVCYIFKLFVVIPNLFKKTQIGFCHLRFIDAIDKVGDGISFLITEIDSGKSVERCIDDVSVLYTGKLLHRCRCFVGFECCFFPDPFGTLSCNGALGKPVFELYLKLGTVKTALSFKLGNIKFPTLFADIINSFVWRESGRGEDKLKLIYLVQLFFKRFIGINRECRSGNL